MKYKKITDIIRFKDDIYRFKLDGIGYIAKLANMNSALCYACKMYDNVSSHQKCQVISSDKEYNRALCVVLTNSICYCIVIISISSLIGISKFKTTL